MANDPDGDFTRRKQTFFLSAEFIITMLIQSMVFLIAGVTVLNKVEARVQALESQQVTAERIARIEVQLTTMIQNQSEFKGVIRDVQSTVQDLRDDANIQRSRQSERPIR